MERLLLPEHFKGDNLYHVKPDDKNYTNKSGNILTGTFTNTKVWPIKFDFPFILVLGYRELIG